MATRRRSERNHGNLGLLRSANKSRDGILNSNCENIFTKKNTKVYDVVISVLTSKKFQNSKL